MEHLELTKEQYLATMHTPMRFIELGDKSDSPFPIGDYVENLITQLALPTTRKEIQIHAVYMNDKKGYCHILFNWGLANVFLVVITIPKEKEVYGYRLLDLNKEYGRNED
jgi:hypothetical protein